MSITYLTEGKIKKHILENIKNSTAADTIKIGMFYLSDRDIIKALKGAAKRDVKIQLILDANKDAFGRKKNGIPNRPVASELSKFPSIKVRWYNTHGEQFHTKIVIFSRNGYTDVFGGSANLTKRNIGDLNLEADIKISATADSKFSKEVISYYDRLWNNSDGSYTLDFSAYNTNSFWLYLTYRIQECSGLSTLKPPKKVSHLSRL